MSTELTQSRTELPALARPVPMSGSLAYYVAGDAAIGGHVSPTVGMPSMADIVEAKRKLVEAEHLCRPAPPQLIATWCARMKTIPKAPVDAADMREKLAAICLACAELPAAVFTAETSKLALQRFKWWPGPAEVYELLSEQARPFIRTLDGLRRVAARGQAEPAMVEIVTSVSREHVASVVHAFVAERSWNQPDGASYNASTSAKPNLPHDVLLLDEYERAAKLGNRLAQTRVVMLRRKLGMDE